MASKSFKPNSTSISEVVYDDKKLSMLVVMRDGSNMQYHKVPPSVFDGWKQAPSAGKYYNSSVRDRYEWEYVL